MDPRVRIVMHGKDLPMMVIFIEDHEYQFSVANVAKECWDWLGDIVAGDLQLAYNRGMRAGIDQVQGDVKKALGLK